jgi:PQQ-dependent dehydrogenase (methanol/ethanol family)
MRRLATSAGCLLLLGLVGFAAGQAPRLVDDTRLKEADREAANWVMYGRTYDDHRFSPLTQINEQSIGRLGLVWSRELGTTRGLEATPLVEDGVIYTTGSWSVVFALDAKTGAVKWTFDPQIDRQRIAGFVCCDVVNRGVALYRGKVYVGTLDGRLIALDARSGDPLWSVQTADTDKPYAITGYPRVARGMVVIGNAGAEYGVRGYISAYDAETGKMLWRSYTVPGDPSRGFESKAMERAAKTWNGDWWTAGGGGTVWEGIVYDPALDLLYFGSGNATAWYRGLRGNGEGDNLYTASILAVRAQTGELAWHFQTAPGDNWDFDATQPLMQADLTIAGRPRQVIMQASKNGFFYVLDRKTGEFISGAPFVSGITWASALDRKTGRPIETPAAYKGLDPIIVSPDPGGAHNWNPMAFNPATGFVYLPAKVGTQALHVPDAKWKYNPRLPNLGSNALYEGPMTAKLRALPPPSGELLAWDPVRQRAAWHASYPVVEGGGVLTTAGNLVFQGRADGILAAYRATDGQRLWEFDAGTGIMAPPVTYLVDGQQFVSVMVGWGGADALQNAPNRGKVRPGYGRMITLALGGTAKLNAPAYGHAGPPSPAITMNESPETIHAGRLLYGAMCSFCHGADAVAGPLPDLRYASKAVHDQFDAIVLGGARASLGMPSFKGVLTADQLRAIQAYILSRAGEGAGSPPK